jgi:type III restriction enzyme
MFNSFHGAVLKSYTTWVASRFREPKVEDCVRDYLIHLSTPPADPNDLTLWPHQRESILRAVYANEVLKPKDPGWKDVLLNVVTGGGKTTIMAALMAYLRVCHEVRSFIVLTPNTIVRERLRLDFDQPSRPKSVWNLFNLFPPEYKHRVHDMTLHVLEPGSGSAGIRSAAVILGNIHQLYTYGVTGRENLAVILTQIGRIGVFNDEAHNTVAPKYDEVLNLFTKSGKTVLRVDTTATPDRADNEPVNSRMIYFYGIKEAVRDGIVKTVYVCQPNIATVELTYTDTETGAVVKVEEVPWEEIDAKRIPATKWVTSPKPLRQQLEMAKRRWIEQVKRAEGGVVQSKEAVRSGGASSWRKYDVQEGGRYRPILFVVAVSIKDAYNAKKVLEEEFGMKTFVIASKDEEETDIDVEQRKRELKTAMTIGTDKDPEQYSAVVSVLMLREGWDVKPVSVICLLRKFSSPVYGQQVIGRGLRRIYPCKQDVKERLVVVDHPKLEHGWLWKLIDAYVKDNVGIQQEIDLDDVPEPEPDESPDSIIPPEPDEDEGDEIILPPPGDTEEQALTGGWQEYLDSIVYQREKVVVTDEKRTGESERELAGDGFVVNVAYDDAESKAPPDYVPPSELVTLEQRKAELPDQLLEMARELLFNTGLPPSGINVLYRVILAHVSAKFLEGKTTGQCDREGQLLLLQDSLHDIRSNLNHRPLLKAILDNPPAE